jgi:dATP/dGTP diphosphohydrolase
MSGKKNDKEKIPMDLFPSEALFEIGKVLQAGQEKYGRANWADGIEISRLIAASLRHTFQFNAGEDLDEETKTIHLANAACNLMFAIWMFKNRPDLDNRWVKSIKK